MAETMFHQRKSQTELAEKTVTLRDRDIRAATRLLNLLLGTDDNPKEQLTPPTLEVPGLSGQTQDRRVLIARAREMFVNRERRLQNFSRAMFGEPAWDMLLALYVTEPSSARLTVSRLVTFSGAPPTTALRWIDYLEKDRLIMRRANPLDRRISLIELSDKGRSALDAYFSGTSTTAM